MDTSNNPDLDPSNVPPALPKPTSPPSDADQLLDRRVTFPPPSFNGIWKTSFLVLRKNYWPITGVAVLAAIITWLASIPVMLLTETALATSSGAQLLSVAGDFVLHMCVSTPLWAGTTYWACRRARGLPTNIAMMFHGFRFFSRLLPFAALIAAIYSAGGLVSAILMMSGMPMAILFSGVARVLCLAIIVWFTLTYGFATVIQLDHEWRAPAFDRGMELSKRLTRGHRTTLLWLFVVISIIVLASVILFFLPFVFFGLPLTLAAYGAAYAVLSQPMLKTSECRACGYDLRTVVGHKCPECGTPKELCSSCSADLSSVQGPTCPSCGHHRFGQVLRSVCLKCQYNLQGINSPVCPECGTPRQTTAI